MRKLAKFIFASAAALMAAATVKAAVVVGPITTVFYKDEGVTVSTTPNTIDFVGSGVTVTKTGVSSVTVTIAGGGGVSVYPATATASFPFGFNSSTLTLTSAGPGVLYAVAGSSLIESATSGTINTSTNPVDWTLLKNVPVGFSDGVDNTGGGLPLTPGDTNYIQNTNTLQSGATGYPELLLTNKIGVGTSDPQTVAQFNYAGGEIIRLKTTSFGSQNTGLTGFVNSSDAMGGYFGFDHAGASGSPANERDRGVGFTFQDENGGTTLGRNNPAARVHIETQSPYRTLIYGPLQIFTTNQIRLNDGDDTNYVGFVAPNSLAGNTIWTLPDADSTGCWQSNGSGVISIAACGGGGASSLAVGTGTATNFTNNVTSPTAVISFHGNLFRVTTNGTTSFVVIDTTTQNGLLMISSAGATYLTLSSATATYLNAVTAAALYQPLDATLTDLANAPLTEDNSIDPSAIAAGDVQNDVRVSSANPALFYSDPTVRSNLGLAIGTNVQAYDADLDDLADGTLSASKVQQNAGTDITADLEEETHASEHQDGGSDEISVTGLSGLLADRQKVAISTGGTLVAVSSSVNLVQGTNITLGTTVDGNGQVNLTINSSASGSADNLGSHVATMTVTASYGLIATTITVTDDAYDATGWNGSTFVATKNAIRDKLEAMPQTAGDHITLTGTDLDVDDDFLLNTGDVGTGAYDFGGATSLEIPNGAAPTVDATGEIAMDTTDGTIIAYDGNNARVVAHATHTYTISFSSGTGWDNLAFPVFVAPEGMAITITKVTAETMPAVSTVTFSLQERAFGSMNSAGSDVFSVTYSTANGAGKTITGFANSGIAAGANVMFVTGTNASAGSPSWFRATISYLLDIE